MFGKAVSTVGLGELHGTTTARALVVASIPFAVSVAFLAAQVLSGDPTTIEVVLGGGLTGGVGTGR